MRLPTSFPRPSLGLLLPHALLAVGTLAADVFELDISQLDEVRWQGSGLLAGVSDYRPVTTNVIRAEDLFASGVRDLNEAVEVLVPNTQVVKHHFLTDHLGIRGIIGDRDDKYLMLVNGVALNNRFYAGASGERDLPLLGDFEAVELVRGPASVSHGVGALVGVLSLNPYRGDSYRGGEVAVRQTVRDPLTATEFKYGTALPQGLGLFVYGGASYREGASQDVAPYVYGRSFTTPDGRQQVGGEPPVFPVARLHANAYDDPLKYKAHLSLTWGPLEFWSRYTQGGVHAPPDRTFVALAPDGTARPNSPVELYAAGSHQQDRRLTNAIAYRDAWSGQWSAEAYLAQTSNWIDDWRAWRGLPNQWDEFGWLSHAVVRWQPLDDHLLALGLDATHYHFSQGPSVLYSGVTVGPERKFDTNTFSPMAEYEWRAHPALTFGLGWRADSHTETDWLHSARLSAVWQPAPRHTTRWVLAEGKRRGNDSELDINAQQGLTDTESERLTSVELRQEYRPDAAWTLSAGAFYQDYEPLAFDASPNQLRTAPVGEFEILGVELELAWQGERDRLSLSHAIQELLDAALYRRADGSVPVQGISAQPYGFGGDLANWAPHASKLLYEHRFNAAWSCSTSLRIAWGFPGNEDLADYNASRPVPSGSLGLADPGYDRPYGIAAYWNAGLAWTPDKAWSLRLDCYNLLDLLDDTTSRRMYINRGTDYSVEPFSLGLSVAYKF